MFGFLKKVGDAIGGQSINKNASQKSAVGSSQKSNDSHSSAVHENEFKIHSPHGIEVKFENSGSRVSTSYNNLNTLNSISPNTLSQQSSRYNTNKSGQISTRDSSRGHFSAAVTPKEFNTALRSSISNNNNLAEQYLQLRQEMRERLNSTGANNSNSSSNSAAVIKHDSSSEGYDGTRRSSSVLVSERQLLSHSVLESGSPSLDQSFPAQSSALNRSSSPLRPSVSKSQSPSTASLQQQQQQQQQRSRNNSPNRLSVSHAGNRLQQPQLQQLGMHQQQELLKLELQNLLAQPQQPFQTHSQQQSSPSDQRRISFVRGRKASSSTPLSHSGKGLSPPKRQTYAQEQQSYSQSQCTLRAPSRPPSATASLSIPISNDSVLSSPSIECRQDQLSPSANSNHDSSFRVSACLYDTYRSDSNCIEQNANISAASPRNDEGSTGSSYSPVAVTPSLLCCLSTSASPQRPTNQTGPRSNTSSGGFASPLAAGATVLNPMINKTTVLPATKALTTSTTAPTVSASTTPTATAATTSTASLSTTLTGTATSTFAFKTPVISRQVRLARPASVAVSTPISHTSGIFSPLTDEETNSALSTETLAPAEYSIPSPSGKGNLPVDRTRWVRVSCPGQKVKLRSKPSVASEAIALLSSDDELHVHKRLVCGFFRLVDGRGYVNKNTVGVQWVEIDGPSPEEAVEETTVRTQWLRMHCPGQRLKVRERPVIIEPAVGQLLANGAEIEVYSKLVQGFYQLANGQGYVNKHTKGVTWEELSGPSAQAIPEQEEGVPTRWVKLQCPGMGVRIRTGPAQDQPEVRVAAHGEELEVLITTVKGFYQLADGTGYLNKFTNSVQFIDLPTGPTPRQTGSSEAPVSFQWLRLICPGLRVRVRSRPEATATTLEHLNDGDELQVTDKLVKGFYRLANGKGFANKYTQNVQWIKIDGPSSPAINISSSPLPTPPRPPLQRTMSRTRPSLYDELDRPSIAAVEAVYDSQTLGNSPSRDSADRSSAYTSTESSPTRRRATSLRRTGGLAVSRLVDEPDTAVPQSANIETQVVMASSSADHYTQAPLPWPVPSADSGRFSGQHLFPTYSAPHTATPSLSTPIGGRQIVIDVGSHCTRAGFVGGTQPSTVFRTAVACSVTSLSSSTSKRLELDPSDGEASRKSYFVGERALSQQSFSVTMPFHSGTVSSWDAMEAVWEYCFREIGADPSGSDVMLTEVHQPSKATRARTVETMFELFDVGATHLHLQPALALFGTGATSGCVVDSGEHSTSVYPIFEGFHLGSSSLKLPYGGAKITEILARMLLDKGLGAHFGDALSERNAVTWKKLDAVRVLKEKYAYVDTNPRVGVDVRAELKLAYESMGSNANVPTSVVLPDGTTVELKEELSNCTEMFFRPRQFDQLLACESDEPLHRAVVKCVMGCGMDLRKGLLSNIVLAGGNTLFRGFEKRFAAELKREVAPGMAASVRVNALSARGNAAWVGGSVVAGMSSFEDRWITAAEYDEFGANIVHTRCPLYI